MLKMNSYIIKNVSSTLGNEMVFSIPKELNDRYYKMNKDYYDIIINLNEKYDNAYADYRNSIDSNEDILKQILDGFSESIGIYERKFFKSKEIIKNEYFDLLLKFSIDALNKIYDKTLETCCLYDDFLDNIGYLIKDCSIEDIINISNEKFFLKKWIDSIIECVESLNCEIVCKK